MLHVPGELGALLLPADLRSRKCTLHWSQDTRIQESDTITWGLGVGVSVEKVTPWWQSCARPKGSRSGAGGYLLARELGRDGIWVSLHEDERVWPDFPLIYGQGTFTNCMFSGASAPLPPTGGPQTACKEEG